MAQRTYDECIRAAGKIAARANIRIAKEKALAAYAAAETQRAA